MLQIFEMIVNPVPNFLRAVYNEYGLQRKCKNTFLDGQL
ncbi:hypothetical protein bthur0003_38580 [Bacillus thuringiensis serovar thuringiensis str. T01001]|nr:hypothetical protein CT43_CH4014 [Bacillus thuringiensis serovar chinensis CT-43]AGG02790.1 hypothetical protein H175_ch4078 [Bacillus thuringiensis serovar thuringiensis str. IS5056]EEM27295.1 hypothetical protein bthur0002_38610 [Bacillus thuringiensis Bt407]EEM33623.1 hypothetical protein bthur0003_38580 [Bacillus thuringiensis serovar thuringiensis str. T01001]EEM64572.1 hypothetical protein bthur0008_38110 [Bacillus thuringiensis serovar berliner ATCC 10792]